MITVAVIGAEGKSGQQFVRAALTQGWRVRAGVHQTGARTLPQHDNLVTISCNALERKDVDQLLQGADVVVSMIGHGKHSPARLQTDAIRTVVETMHAHGITRLISLTGTGVRFPGDHIPLYDYALNIPLKFLMRARIEDGIAHAKMLQESSLEWTIIRCLKLTNGQVETYRLTPHGPAKLFVPRKTVADAAVRCIDERLFIRQAPIISPLRT